MGNQRVRSVRLCRGQPPGGGGRALCSSWNQSECEPIESGRLAIKRRPGTQAGRKEANRMFSTVCGSDADGVHMSRVSVERRRQYSRVRPITVKSRGGRLDAFSMGEGAVRHGVHCLPRVWGHVLRTRSAGALADERCGPSAGGAAKRAGPGSDGEGILGAARHAGRSKTKTAANVEASLLFRYRSSRALGQHEPARSSQRDSFEASIGDSRLPEIRGPASGHLHSDPMANTTLPPSASRQLDLHQFLSLSVQDNQSLACIDSSTTAEAGLKGLSNSQIS